MCTVGNLMLLANNLFRIPPLNASASHPLASAHSNSTCGCWALRPEDAPRYGELDLGWARPIAGVELDPEPMHPVIANLSTDGRVWRSFVCPGRICLLPELIIARYVRVIVIERFENLNGDAPTISAAALGCRFGIGFTNNSAGDTSSLIQITHNQTARPNVTVRLPNGTRLPTLVFDDTICAHPDRPDLTSSFLSEALSLFGMRDAVDSFVRSRALAHCRAGDGFSQWVIPMVPRGDEAVTLNVWVE